MRRLRDCALAWVELFRHLRDHPIEHGIGYGQSGENELTWMCMICGTRRPDAEIAVASRTVGFFTVNIRYCRASDACREAALTRAAEDAARFGPRQDVDGHIDAHLLAIGCTYEGCATGDEPWIAIMGNPGSDVGGEVAVLCESHFKMTVAPDTNMEDFVAHVRFVNVADYEPTP